MTKCDIIGHNYIPLDYDWVEYVSGMRNNNPFNREGSYLLKSVYCKRCGIVKIIKRYDGRVYYE